MRFCLVLSALAAVLLLAPEAQAQFLTFDNEGQFLLTVDNTTSIPFEEVSDTDVLNVTDQNGAFTRETVNFAVSDVHGNPAFGQIVGRDFFQANNLGDYNLGSGDFLLTGSEFPVTMSMDFTAIDPLGVGFRIDDRVGNGALAVVVRTILNTQIESFNFGVNTASANDTFFGFVGTGGRQVLDVTVTGDVSNRTSQIAFDSIVAARSLRTSAPAPASLPLFGAGLAAIGIALRRKRV